MCVWRGRRNARHGAREAVDAVPGGEKKRGTGSVVVAAATPAPGGRGQESGKRGGGRGREGRVDAFFFFCINVSFEAFYSPPRVEHDKRTKDAVGDASATRCGVPSTKSGNKRVASARAEQVDAFFFFFINVSF